MSLTPCKLDRYTGTYIRFRTSRLPLLPAADADRMIELPDGTLVPGRFNRNRKNPNVTGPVLVRYLKRRLGARSTEDALIDLDRPVWKLYLLDAQAAVLADAGAPAVVRQRAGRGELHPADLRRLPDRLDAAAGASERRKAYARLLRPSVLRRLVLDLMGPSCQVRGCRAAEETAATWGQAAAAAVVEVHHLEAVARRPDHHPANLCVLCANHHRLIHGFGPWRIDHDAGGGGLSLTRDGGSLRIERDLAFLGE